jgi:hypothetical protein
MSEETQTITPKRRRASNRIGLQEFDEDGNLWLSSGKTYSCTASAPSSDSEDADESSNSC